MGGAIAIRRFEFNNDIAIAGKRQALLRNRGPRDVAAKPFELLPLACFTGDTSVSGETRTLAHLFITKSGIINRW